MNQDKHNHEDKSCPVVGTIARWTRRKDARPGEILDAALDQFVARGFAATKMEHIARAAGVTPGTLYRYYPGKEEILKALIHDSFQRVFAEAEPIMAQFQGTASEMLGLVLRTWWDMVGATKISGLAKLMMAEASNFPELARFHEAEVIKPGEAFIERAVQLGIANGEFRPINVKAAVKMAVAPILMAMLWKHSESCNLEGLDLELYLDEAIQTLQRGLAAR